MNLHSAFLNTLLANFFMYTSYGELLFDSETYPIILSMENDKALFILPEKGCHILTDSRSIQRTLRQQNVYNTDSETLSELITLCTHYQNDKINASQFVLGIQQRGFLIYPGTHFCGAGDNAANDTDLGYYTETDKCCREHDHCNNYINGWSCHSKLSDLCNYTPFTRSHCSCDQNFRECLQKSNDTASMRIGVLYFTVFGLKCFREDYPIVSCEEYGGFLNIHCQKYLLDGRNEKIYQFFDSPKYSRGTVVPVNESNVIEIESSTVLSSSHSPYKDMPSLFLQSSA